MSLSCCLVVNEQHNKIRNSRKPSFPVFCFLKICSTESKVGFSYLYQEEVVYFIPVYNFMSEIGPWKGSNSLICGKFQEGT